MKNPGYISDSVYGLTAMLNLISCRMDPA